MSRANSASSALNTVREQSVTSTEGLFDSGAIPPGGGFSMKLQVPGTHRYRSSGSGG